MLFRSEARVRRGELRKFAALLPVETPRVDQHAADRDAVAAEELCRRVIQEIGAEFEGLHQVGRRERRIDQQRQLRLVRDLRHRGDVQYIQAGIAQCFTEQEPGVVSYGVLPRTEVARTDKGRINAKSFQRVAEQIVRAAIKRIGGRSEERRVGKECRL